MIRRGFWLALGATGGIMGYRRVTAIGRQLSATLSPAVGGGVAPAPPGVDHGVEDHRTGAAVAGQAGRVGAVLTARASRGLLRGTIRFSRDARMFSRDVREGMDLYMVRHPARRSPTLGAGAQSRRSPAPPSVIEAPGATTATDDRVKDDR